MTARAFGAVAAIVALLAAIVAVHVVAASEPVMAGTPGGGRVVRDVAYAAPAPAGSRGHLLDLYLPTGEPAGSTGEDRAGEGDDGDDGARDLLGGLFQRLSDRDAGAPLIIWTGGSGWLSDEGKGSAADVADWFTARGYAVAGVSVRSSEQARFPAQLHDVKAAIRWLRANAGQYGLDPGRFAAAGDSSGGWVATMAAVTGDEPGLEGDIGVQGTSSAVQAAVDLFGPTDLLAMDRQMAERGCGEMAAAFSAPACHNDPRSPESRLVGCPIQACPAAAAKANPLRYADDGDPPMLIVHGTDDPFVPVGQSELLYGALRSECVPATLLRVEGAGHDWRQVLGLDAPRTYDAALTRDCREEMATGEDGPGLAAIEQFLQAALPSDR